MVGQINDITFRVLLENGSAIYIQSGEKQNVLYMINSTPMIDAFNYRCKKMKDVSEVSDS